MGFVFGRQETPGNQRKTNNPEAESIRRFEKTDQ
jgi:hypothetical protein